MLIKKKNILKKNYLKNELSKMVENYEPKFQNSNNNKLVEINKLNLIDENNFINLSYNEKENYANNLFLTFNKNLTLYNEQICLDILIFLFNTKEYLSIFNLKGLINIIIEFILNFGVKDINLLFFENFFNINELLLIRWLSEDGMFKYLLTKLNNNQYNYNSIILDIIYLYIIDNKDISIEEYELIFINWNNNEYLKNSMKSKYLVIINEIFIKGLLFNRLNYFNIILSILTNYFNNLLFFENKELILNIVGFIINNGYPNLKLDYQILYKDIDKNYKFLILKIMYCQLKLTNYIDFIENKIIFLEFWMHLIEYNNKIEFNIILISIINVIIINLEVSLINKINFKSYFFKKILSIYNLNNIQLRTLVKEFEEIITQKNIN